MAMAMAPTAATALSMMTTTWLARAVARGRVKKSRLSQTMKHGFGSEERNEERKCTAGLLNQLTQRIHDRPDVRELLSGTHAPVTFLFSPLSQTRTLDCLCLRRDACVPALRFSMAGPLRHLIVGKA